MKYGEDSTLEHQVKSVKRWVCAIGFDSWQARGYRSIELLGGMKTDIFKPDQFRAKQVQAMVSTIAQNREIVVTDAVASCALGLADGRLAGHRFGETTCTAEAQSITNGFFDEYDVPSWDTWLAFIEDDTISQSTSPYLLNWIPPELIEKVDEAIRASFEENIFWVN